MNAITIKMMAMAVASLVASASAALCGKRHRPQLHLVSRRIGARLYAGAASSGTTADIHRAATRKLCPPRARRSVFEAIHVGRCSKSQFADGTCPVGLLFQSAARAADDGNRELVARGEAIYQRGIPEANIAACVACHGPNAEGISDSSDRRARLRLPQTSP
jgi:hypothetical protein